MCPHILVDIYVCMGKLFGLKFYKDYFRSSLCAIICLQKFLTREIVKKRTIIKKTKAKKKKTLPKSI